MRLADESRAIREAYPAELVDLAAFVTDLGGVTGVMLVLSLVYWVTAERRERAALVASYTVVAVGVIMLTKYGLAMSRPPESAFVVPLEDDPYGFPSGHAFIAVVVYGGLALAYDRLDDRATMFGVGALVAAISVSRVVLGLHYLSDVLAGIAMGIAVLWLLHWGVDGNPRLGFAIGAVAAIPAIAISGGEPYVLVGLGAAIGGFVAAGSIRSLPSRQSRFGSGFLVIVGLAFLIGVSTIESTVVGELSGGPVPLAADVALVAINAVLVAGVLLAPAILGRLDLGPIGTR